MSTPAPTPTNPPATPPATVSDLNESRAATSTDCDGPAVSTVFTWLRSAMKADVVALNSVTPVGMETPTNPAPTTMTIPKTSSLDRACTARPWNEALVEYCFPRGRVPSETKLSIPPVDPAAASIVESAPAYAEVFFLIEATVTPAPTPTNPPATPPVIASSLVSSA